MLLSLLALPAVAGPFDTPDQISWEVPGSTTECRIAFDDTPRFRCGQMQWTDIEGDTRRLDRAMRRLDPRRLLNAEFEPHSFTPTLTLFDGARSVAFTGHTAEIVEVVDAARELIALDDPLAVPEVPFTGCDIALRSWVRPTGRAAAADPAHRAPARDLMVCESGAWFGFEEGHLVKRGWIDAPLMDGLMALADPLVDLEDPQFPANPDDRWDVPTVLCPDVERTRAFGLEVRGRPIAHGFCDQTLPEQQPFDQRLRQLIPWR